VLRFADEVVDARGAAHEQKLAVELFGVGQHGHEHVGQEWSEHEAGVILLQQALERDYLETNPAMNIDARAKNSGRTRVLTEHELAEVWQACGDNDYGRVIRLLILTGQRRTEIGNLCWSEMPEGKQQIELTDMRTKNKQPHIVPLTDAAVALLPKRSEARDFVFGVRGNGYSGWAEGKADLDAAITKARKSKPLPHWTVHDLRRSFVTHISELGIAPPHIVEALVNHVSGHKGGVAGVYNKALYLKERREALELWAAHIARLVLRPEPQRSTKPKQPASHSANITAA